MGRTFLAITRCLEQFLLNLSLRMHKIGHLSTSGQISNLKYETFVVKFPFDNEIWYICAKICAAFVMQNFQHFVAVDGDCQKGNCRQIPSFLSC